MNEIKTSLPSDMEIINGLEEMKTDIKKTIGNLLQNNNSMDVFTPKIKITKEEIIARFSIFYITKEILLQIIDLLGDRGYSLKIWGKKLLLVIER